MEPDSEASFPNCLIDDHIQSDENEGNGYFSNELTNIKQNAFQSTMQKFQNYQSNISTINNMITSNDNINPLELVRHDDQHVHSIKQTISKYKF